METHYDGSLYFRKKGKPVFIFDKKNYDIHCSRHQLLKENWFLEEVEKTLFSPDVITKGLSKKIRMHYKVIKSHHAKYDIWINLAIRIPFIFRKNKKGKIICFIKSVHDRQGFSDQIIHPIEERIWESPRSLI